jgi:cytochrome c biogenesis protein CcmG/thiol:disulfide interchange protein DsbE
VRARLIEAHRAYGTTSRLIGVSATRGSLTVVGLPQTELVDAQGTMVATERVAFRSYADLSAAIEKQRGVSP